MAENGKRKTFDAGRDAGKGRFIPVEEAERRKKTAIVSGKHQFMNLRLPPLADALKLFLNNGWTQLLQKRPLLIGEVFAIWPLLLSPKIF
jgi:hypothetical protein